ncbi:MAG: DNA polymerase III subunit delta' [Roseiflexaceae bacterium]|nr:DNA polymerase III subunit delta' [Chloroflexaceae bacterium]
MDTSIATTTWGIVGHRWAIEMVQQAVAAQRTAHAYLISGPRHVGKALLALRMAQLLNCEQQGGTPCGSCRACKRIAHGNHPDVRHASLVTQAAALKSDEATRQRDLRIDTIRTALTDITLRPFEGRRRVFIIDDVERLSEGAANAMLKVLEEPPPHATLILIAHTAGDVMATIVSRCQSIKLRPVARDAIAHWLTTQGVAAETAHVYAAWSEGLPGLADYYAHHPDAAQQLQHQLDELLALSTRPLHECFKWVEEQNKAFRGGEQSDVYATLTLWQRWWRDVLITAAGLPDAITWVDRATDIRRVASGTGVLPAAQFVRLLTQAVRQLRENTNPQLVFEHLILQLPDRH